MSYFISCPKKGVCPGYMILFPVLCKYSARIYDFLSCPQRGFCRRYYFLSCPLKRLLHGNIILFPAGGKTFARIYFYLMPVERLLPGDIIFMFWPLKGFCPEGLFSFLRWIGCCPSLSLRGSNSIRAGGACTVLSVGVGLPDVVARFRSFLCVVAVQKQLS